MSDPALIGGCACGAARFELTGPSEFAFLCQCRDCQRVTGSDHATLVCHSADRFSATGPIQTWARETKTGASVIKRFCATCASPLWGATTRVPSVVMVMAGALDTPDAVTPDRIFYENEKISWDHASVPTTE